MKKLICVFSLLIIQLSGNTSFAGDFEWVALDLFGDVVAGPFMTVTECRTWIRDHTDWTCVAVPAR